MVYRYQHDAIPQIVQCMNSLCAQRVHPRPVRVAARPRHTSRADLDMSWLSILGKIEDGVDAANFRFLPVQQRLGSRVREACKRHYFKHRMQLQVAATWLIFGTPEDNGWSRETTPTSCCIDRHRGCFSLLYLPFSPPLFPAAAPLDLHNNPPSA